MTRFNLPTDEVCLSESIETSPQTSSSFTSVRSFSSGNKPMEPSYICIWAGLHESGKKILVVGSAGRSFYQQNNGEDFTRWALRTSSGSGQRIASEASCSALEAPVRSAPPEIRFKSTLVLVLDLLNKHIELTGSQAQGSIFKIKHHQSMNLQSLNNSDFQMIFEPCRWKARFIWHHLSFKWKRWRQDIHLQISRLVHDSDKIS